MNKKQSRREVNWELLFAAGTFLLVIVGTNLAGSNSTNARIDNVILDGNAERREIRALLAVTRQEIRELREDQLEQNARLIRIEELLQENN